MLYQLQASMNAVVEDTPFEDSNDDDDIQSSDSNTSEPHPTPSVIRIAAQASLLLVDKYLDLIWHCDIYIIALGVQFIFLIYIIILNGNKVMCPDRKLEWFRTHQPSTTERRRIKALVVTRWKLNYAPANSSDNTVQLNKDQKKLV